MHVNLKTESSQLSTQTQKSPCSEAALLKERAVRAQNPFQCRTSCRLQWRTSPFFACDDDFVWPVLSSSDKIPYVGVTMCSIPYTPESNSNSKDEAANLGFSSKRDVQNSDKEFLVKLTEDSGKDVVEDVKEDKEFRVNLTANSSFLVEVIENVKEGEKNEALRRSNSLLRASKLVTKSSLMVEDGNHGTEFIKEGEKNEVNLAAKASKLEAKSRLKVEDDNNEIGTVKKGEINKGFRANLAAKDLKRSTNLGANSRLKVGNEVMKKEEIRVRKASKLEGKTSVSAMECLIEVLKHTCDVTENENADILATVTRRGMTFPLPRGDVFDGFRALYNCSRKSHVSG